MSVHGRECRYCVSTDCIFPRLSVHCWTMCWKLRGVFEKDAEAAAGTDAAAASLELAAGAPLPINLSRCRRLSDIGFHVPLSTMFNVAAFIHKQEHEQ